MATGDTEILGIVDRIIRLTMSEQVVDSLPTMDIEQLQHRAQEAMHALADQPVNAASPALCCLAVECISVVERAELSTALARLVTTGCEILAAAATSTNGIGRDLFWLKFLVRTIRCGSVQKSNKTSGCQKRLQAAAATAAAKAKTEFVMVGDMATSDTELLGIVDRIMRLTMSEHVADTLATMDIEHLQHRAQEAMHALADQPVNAASSALCCLAVECISVVERAELSTALARVVTTGCEILAALLLPRMGSAEACSGGGSGLHFSWVDGFDWVEDTLEDLSDKLDFLALEVYCGLGRLEGTVSESDALPVVLDADLDNLGTYWGSIEHKLALQELSTWLLCVVFRALGYGAVTARHLMEFANHDVLCLCALLRGLLALNPDTAQGLPHDTAEIHGAALKAVCGLTAPELAFPHVDGSESIEQQNRLLHCYLEILCAAVVETGLLEALLPAALANAQRDLALGQASAHGWKVLALLAALMLEADAVEPSVEDPSPPPLQFREVLMCRADQLGSLLEAVLASGCPEPARLKELVVNCAILSAGLAAHCVPDCPDDGFTLACRMLLATGLDLCCGQGPDVATLLVALATIAANVGDLEISRARLLELIGGLHADDSRRARARLTRRDRMRLPVHGELIGGLHADDSRRARARLTRRDRMRLPVHGGPAPVLELFPLEAAAAAGAEESTAPTQMSLPAAPTSEPPKAPFVGLRDVVQNAPKDFRCALDGKLLCDPVVSPAGIVFERSTLASWLHMHGPQCPMTGVPLQMEDCQRSPEIRKKAAGWDALQPDNILKNMPGRLEKRLSQLRGSSGFEPASSEKE
eukprot:CAMPEP_0172932576 /NCGR_PEP_ID=MMETSP1075-20121228/220066_1 /TAXON_ID=2916 /ORGANISM="Ceratium fusus, Strain PA161109" /LENGTH=819 /DNA_ID=CAMNT_0013793905 /DNA_START=58 /DNA_END=2518 /DNA_ORIENTATION=-